MSLTSSSQLLLCECDHLLQILQMCIGCVAFSRQSQCTHERALTSTQCCVACHHCSFLHNGDRQLAGTSTVIYELLSAQMNPVDMCCGVTKQAGEPKKAHMGVLLDSIDCWKHIHSKGHCLEAMHMCRGPNNYAILCYARYGRSPDQNICLDSTTYTAKSIAPCAEAW